MNQVIVDGFVNNFRHGMTRNDNAWCSFSLSNSTYAGKDDSGKNQYAKNWFNVSTFDGLAEACIRAFDGKDGAFLVTVMGSMEEREYTTEEGETRKAWNLKAREITRGGAISTFANDAPSASAAPVSSGSTF